jgi:hypothetical protein
MIDKSRAAFEAWVKSVHLDAVTRVKDAWGEDCYLPHINSMWFGWQASRKVALNEAWDACIAIATAPSNCTLGVAISCGDAIRNLK